MSRLLEPANGKMSAKARVRRNLGFVTMYGKQTINERLVQIEHILWNKDASAFEMNGYLDL